MRWRAALTEAANREIVAIGQQIVDLSPPTLAEIRPGALRQSLHSAKPDATGILLSSTIRTAKTGARVEIGPFGIVRYDAENKPQTLRNPGHPWYAEIDVGRQFGVAATVGGCRHANPQPVILITDEVVAAVCPDCLQPLPPSAVGSDWKP